MFSFSSPLFWYKLIFIVELLVAEALATYSLRKKPKFALRVAACVLGIFVVGFLFPIFFYNAVYSSFMFLFLFGVTLIGLKLCYDEPWSHIIFCAVIAYTTQHMAYETFKYTLYVFDLGSIVTVYDEVGELQINGFMGLAYGASYAFIYWAVWAFVEYRIRIQQNICLKNKSLLFLSGIIVLIDIVLGALLTYDTDSNLSMMVQTVLFLYSLISCIICLVMQFLMLEQQHAEHELKEIQAMWRQDKRMYELSKENVELINIKCHDLKKQIRLLRSSEGEIERSSLKEIEKAIDFYDATVKTGNEALDLILAEKSLFCSQNDIKLTCIADGSSLNHIPMLDLYSLFENAVQNAIEAVSKYSEPEKRFVRIKVVKREGMVSIHIENYFDGEVWFADGSPQTGRAAAKWRKIGAKSKAEARKSAKCVSKSVNYDKKDMLLLRLRRSWGIMFPLRKRVNSGRGICLRLRS